MLKKEIINQTKWYCIYMDWSIAFGGKSMGNRHLFRVNKIIKFLAKKEKADIFVAEMGGWVHDLSLINGNDNSPENIRTIVEPFLISLKMNSNLTNKILECAISHEGGKKAMSLESKIVHDADVIDKSGILGIIRHSWKVVNLINPNIKTDDLFNLLQKHLKERQQKIYIKSAKLLVNKLNSNNIKFFKEKTKAKEMLDLIMPMAKKGITSDAIALYLIKKKTFFNDSLKDQLKCSYLE